MDILLITMSVSVRQGLYSIISSLDSNDFLFNELKTVYEQIGYGFKPIVFNTDNVITFNIHPIQMILLIEKLFPNRFIIRSDINILHYPEYIVPNPIYKRRNAYNLCNLYLASIPDGSYEPLYDFHYKTLLDYTQVGNGVILKGGYYYEDD